VQIYTDRDLPLISDLLHVLKIGVEASGMPFLDIAERPEPDRSGGLIKTFSPRWQAEKPGDPINIPRSRR